MTENIIPLPDLPSEQIKQILALRDQGQTLKAICAKTGLRYPVVYFYAINKGVRLSGDNHLKPIGCKMCATKPYAKGLCINCYQRSWRRGRVK
jgi:hypothetical protein